MLVLSSSVSEENCMEILWRTCDEEGAYYSSSLEMYLCSPAGPS